MKTHPTKTPTNQSPLSKLPAREYARYPRKSEQNTPRHKPLPRQPPKPMNNTQSRPHQKAPANNTHQKKRLTITLPSNYQPPPVTRKRAPHTPANHHQKTRAPHTSQPPPENSPAPVTKNSQQKRPLQSRAQTLHCPRTHQPPGKRPPHQQATATSPAQHQNSNQLSCSNPHQYARAQQNSPEPKNQSPHQPPKSNQSPANRHNKPISNFPHHVQNTHSPITPRKRPTPDRQTTNQNAPTINPTIQKPRQPPVTAHPRKRPPHTPVNPASKHSNYPTHKNDLTNHAPDKEPITTRARLCALPP